MERSINRRLLLKLGAASILTTGCKALGAESPTPTASSYHLVQHNNPDYQLKQIGRNVIEVYDSKYDNRVAGVHAINETCKVISSSDDSYIRVTHVTTEQDDCLDKIK